MPASACLHVSTFAVSTGQLAWFDSRAAGVTAAAALLTMEGLNYTIQWVVTKGNYVMYVAVLEPAVIGHMPGVSVAVDLSNTNRLQRAEELQTT